MLIPIKILKVELIEFGCNSCDKFVKDFIIQVGSIYICKHCISQLIVWVEDHRCEIRIM